MVEPCFNNLIGYATLEEWEKHAPGHPAPEDQMPPVTRTAARLRAVLPVYLMLQDKTASESPPHTHVYTCLSYLDDSGDLHYWRMLMGTYYDMRPLMSEDQRAVTFARGGYQLIGAWLAEHGFANIIEGMVSHHKDMTLLAGRAHMLQYTKNDGWVRIIPGEAPK